MQHTETLPTHTHDKQLQGIALDCVMEKRSLDQALNAKEFAVCAGVSYSTARSWFHLPGFPVFHGVVFWKDFVQWRTEHYALQNPSFRNATVIALPRLQACLRGPHRFFLTLISK